MLTLQRYRKNRLEATLNGRKPERFTDAPASNVTAVAERLGVDAAWFAERVAECAEVGPVVQFDGPADAANAAAFTVTLRTIGVPGGGTEYTDADPLAAMDAALAADVAGDSEIRWSDANRLAVCDVDYHGETPAPPAAKLQSLIAQVVPRPARWWVSRGGGAHLLYVGTPTTSARLLAAAGGVSVVLADPSATFDVLTHCRRPRGEINRCIPSADLSPVRRLLGTEADPAAVDDWLVERGVNRNAAYTHDRCPVAPGVPSHGEPVFFGNDCVTCHKCTAMGTVHGSKAPGVFPYAAFVRRDAMSDVRVMVENFTHWDHARYVLAARLPVSLAANANLRIIYEALLCAVHGNDDPRIAAVFTAGEGVFRFRGFWGNDAGQPYVVSADRQVAALPATWTPEGKAVPQKVDTLNETHSLHAYGYPYLSIISGLRMNRRQPAEGAFFNVRQAWMEGVPWDRHPRYRHAVERLGVAEAWRRVEEVFPGVDREYLMLLLAAKGCTENLAGLPPILLVTGPTGVGKTATPQLVAAMLGDEYSALTWEKGKAAFERGFAEAAKRGSFVGIDEFFKHADADGFSPRQAADRFLTLTPATLTHELYIGRVPLGRMPVTIITDTATPREVAEDGQFGRRTVGVALRSRVEWEPTLATSGVRQISRFRWHSPYYADACDAITSGVVDRWFTGETPPFEAIAAELGYPRLENSAVAMEGVNELRRFYAAVRAAANGDGYAHIEVGATDPLATLWDGMCDSTLFWRTRRQSRRVLEADWKTLTGSAQPVACEIKPDGTTGVRVRFITAGAA
jgi:hypothetical protein